MINERPNVGFFNENQSLPRGAKRERHAMSRQPVKPPVLRTLPAEAKKGMEGSGQTHLKFIFHLY
jgi:hypothetical protein